jgi:ATP-independent RNA helicase DbpA
MSPPAPRTFGDLSLSPELVQTTAELGYKLMTPIQARSIPLLLAGQDVIGQSQTGSGKTAAFSLPILQALDPSLREVQALVLSPTRELGTQVAGEIRKLGRKIPGLQVLIVSGGQPIGPQLGALDKGVHVVVGTPGRVLDILRRRAMDLRRVRTVVLDEADRMLEMGFQEDMEDILSRAPKERQTVLFSATFPRTIEVLSRAYQRSPVRVTVEREEQSVAGIRQVVFEANPEMKFKTLLWLLQQNRPESAIVFCNLKANVIDVAEGLARAGTSAAALHGDLEQRDRDKVMARFRNQSVRILVATDVAARGIDVPDLDAVFNYDLPSQPEIYVHRIGRTGRAGKKGFAASLCTTREWAKVASIEKLTGHALVRKQVPSLDHLDPEQKHGGHESTAAMQTLFISGGRKEKVRPGDILGALTGEAGGLAGSDVGKIEIHDHFSYVAVATRVARVALERLRSGRIKGRKFRVEAVR